MFIIFQIFIYNSKRRTKAKQSDLFAKEVVDFFKSVPENDLSFSGLKSQLQQGTDIVLHLKAIIESIRGDEQTNSPSLSQSRFVENFNKPLNL